MSAELKRALLVVAAVTFLIAAGGLFYVISSSRGSDHVDVSKIFAAAQGYAQGLKAQGKPVPTTVPMKELIRGGLLTEEDVAGFNGMEVIVTLPQAAHRPQDVLIRARLPNGDEVVALADGSIQEVRR